MSVVSRFCLAVSLVLLLSPRLTLADTPEIVPGELLIGFKSGVTAVPSATLQDRSIAGVLGAHAPLRVIRVRVANGFTLEQAASRLRTQPDVEYVEPNGIYHHTGTPNDPSYASQWAPKKIQADLAWDQWKPVGAIIIAIVDTGIDYNHPDLTNKILRSGGAVVGTNTVGSNARSGVATDPIDDQGHGTHCSGIAAAQINNGVGVAGIAGWNGSATSTETSFTKLMPVKVLSSTGSGTDATVAAGITWAADHGANVISMSLGGGGSTTLSNAVAYAWNKGCVIAAAAGNSSSSSKSYPAAYPNVLAVASTDNTDTLSSFSNYGTWVNCAAPGSSIYSTLPTVATGGGFGTNYGTLSGTSMATPHVAGEAALILAQNPSLTNSQVTAIIKGNTDAYNPYQTRTIAVGAGRINVLKALLAAGGGTLPTPPAAPTGLNATASSGLVALGWTASTGATGYNVKRSTVSGGPYNTIGTAAATNYSDTTVVNGTTYYYVVSATNAGGESGNSAQVIAIPPVPPVSTQVLVNPGFENGTNTAPWVMTAGVINNSKSEPSHSGSWNAWLNGYGKAHTDSVYQQVALAAGKTSAVLSFYLHIDTAETSTTAANDTLKVQITDATGVVLATLATYSNLNKNTGYALKTFDVSAYIGQTIRVSLVGVENGSKQTSFVVDDFSLIVK